MKYPCKLCLVRAACDRFCSDVDIYKDYIYIFSRKVNNYTSYLVLTLSIINFILAVTLDTKNPALWYTIFRWTLSAILFSGVTLNIYLQFFYFKKIKREVEKRYEDSIYRESFYR